MLVFLNHYAAPLTNSSILISEFEKVWLPWCRLESLPGDCFDGDIISLVVYFVGVLNPSSHVIKSSNWWSMLKQSRVFLALRMH